MANLHFTEFDLTTGRILATGTCEAGALPEPRPGAAVAELRVDLPARRKILHDGLDEGGRPRNVRPADGLYDWSGSRPAPDPSQERQWVTKSEWQAVLDRLSGAESKAAALQKQIDFQTTQIQQLQGGTEPPLP